MLKISGYRDRVLCASVRILKSQRKVGHLNLTGHPKIFSPISGQHLRKLKFSELLWQSQHLK